MKVIITVSIFILLYFFSSIFGSEYLWGISHLSYLPKYMYIFPIILILVSIIPKSKNSLDNYFNRTADKKLSLRIIIGLIFISFVLFAQAIPILGDGFLRIRNIEAGMMISGAEPGDTFVHAVVYRLLNNFVTVSGAAVYSLVSLLSGAGFLIYLAKRSIRLFDNHSDQLFFILILVFNGIFYQFFGYVESYSILILLLSMLLTELIISLKYIEYNLSIPVLLALAIITHPVALIFLPAYFIYFFKIRFPLKKIIIDLIIMAGIGAMLVIMSLIAGKGLFGFLPEPGENTLLPVLSSADIYGAFSFFHLLDILNLLFLAAPVIIINLLFGVEKYSKITKSFLIISIIPILFVLFFNPALGFARDWDLFSIAFIPLILVFSFQLAQNKEYRIPGFLILLAVFIPWAGVNHSESASVKRTESLAGTDYWTKKSRANLHDELSHYYYENNDKENALRNIYKSDSLRPNERQIYKAGVINFELGRFNQALNDFLSISSADYEKQKVNEMLAVIYYNLGNFDESVKYWEKLVEYKPDDKIKALNNIAMCHYTNSNWIKAIAAFKDIISFDPLNKSALNYLAEIYYKTGDTRNAIVIYNKLLKIEPSNSGYYFNLALCQADSEMFREALENAEKAKAAGFDPVTINEFIRSVQAAVK